MLELFVMVASHFVLVMLVMFQTPTQRDRETNDRSYDRACRFYVGHGFGDGLNLEILSDHSMVQETCLINQV